MLITVEDRQRSKEFRYMCELRRLERIRKLLLLFEENIPKSVTGLPHDIWIDDAGGERQVQHNKPRIKVRVNGDFIPVSIEAEPRILVDKKIPKFNKVSKWIQDYKDVLKSHWDGEINSNDFMDSLSGK